MKSSFIAILLMLITTVAFRVSSKSIGELNLDKMERNIEKFCKNIIDRINRISYHDCKRIVAAKRSGRDWLVTEANSSSAGDEQPGWNVSSTGAQDYDDDDDWSPPEEPSSSLDDWKPVPVVPPSGIRYGRRAAPPPERSVRRESWSSAPAPSSGGRVCDPLAVPSLADGLIVSAVPWRRDAGRDGPKQSSHRIALEQLFRDGLIFPATWNGSG